MIVVGLGKPSEFAPLVFEEAGGAAAALLARETAAAIGAHAFTPEQAAQVALGATLRSYRFDRYRTKEKPEDKPKLEKLTLLVADPTKGKAAWEPLAAVANGVFLTRDLVSEPANVLNPAEMANRCKSRLSLA